MSEGQGVVQDNSLTGNGAPGDAGHLGNRGGPAGPGKIAGAPISWGVCEVPGWGYQLSPGRVLAEMTEVGLAATELGPAGFLPGDPGHAARVLRQHHLAPVGGFVPVRLHVPGHDPLPEIEQVLQGYADTGSRTLVLSADSGLAGYDTRPVLDEDGWTTLLTNLDRRRKRHKYTGNAGTHLERSFLLLIETQQRLRLFDLGLRRSKLHFDRLGIDVQLLLADLVLRRQLFRVIL